MKSSRDPQVKAPPPLLEVVGVRKGYGAGAKRTEVLGGIDLRIEEGEFVAIVGFSGSGKTSLISVMAGLIDPDEGIVRMEGEPIRGPGPDRGVVFQNYSLLPWLTVTGNVALAVDAVFPEWPATRRREHVERYVSLVGLTPARHKRPAELSGGMRQRVALARGLAIEPKVLLLDEPLSALDALTRASLQREIDRIRSEDRRTVVLITNDVDEALLLADRVIPLNPGPNATLGPAFQVAIARPRDRREMNHDPEFIRSRNAIVKYLIDAGGGRAQTATGLLPPTLVPIDLAAPRRVA